MSTDVNTERIISKWMDRIETRLNACSLEVLQNSQSCDDDEKQVYPLIVGCYQLNENSATSSDSETSGADKNRNANSGDERSGELRLHLISSRSSVVKFGEPVQLLVTESGVLDGKWYHHQHFSNSRVDTEKGSDKRSTPVYATACASGRINLYGLEDQWSNNKCHFQLKHLASSLRNDDESSPENYGLCLSLDWDDYGYDLDNYSNTRIVSSYSGGHIAIHDINLFASDDADSSIEPIKESHRWNNAHTLFGCPSEVWTTCFATNKYYNTYRDVVISGGDDCKLKLWDVRSCSNRPTHTVGDGEFEAGVTAVSFHPLLDHVFASGSYDEGLRIWDMRKFSSGCDPLFKIDSVGGGVWRVKWHPQNEGKILVGAMHGGCRILNIPNLVDTVTNDDSSITEGDTSESSVEVVKEFTEHKSMAYGADWIVSHDNFEVAASCSFYDRQGYIWS